MKIPIRYFMAVWLCIFLWQPLSAQKTAIYYDVNQAYMKGLELFDAKDYVNARKKFEEVLNSSRFITNPEIVTFKINAEYYRAIAALELLNPDGELLLTDFLENNVGNEKTNLAYFHLGKYNYNKRDYRDAIDYFEKVDPYELLGEQRDDYKFMLAYSYFFKKEFTLAKRLFAEVQSSKIYYYPAYYYHGFISFMEGDYDTALKDFQKVTESNYFGQVVPYYITSIYFQNKQYDKVIEYAKPVLEDKRVKYYAEITQLLGKAYFEKKQYDQALPYLAYYAENNLRLTKEDLFQLGYAQYMAKDYNSAIDNLQQLVRMNDSLGQNAQYILADAYLQSGEKAKARTAFMEASQMKFDPVIQENALFNYSKTSYELGYSNTSVSSLRQFLNQYPNSEYSNKAKELLTDILLNTRNYKEALEVLETINNKTPKVKEAFQKVAYYRGVEQYNNNQYNEADKLFNKSLEYPIDAGLQAQAYYWKGEIDMQQESYEEAITNFNKFMNMASLSKNLPPQSSLATANYGMGYAYYKLEKFGTALSYFDKAQQSMNSWPSTAAHRGLKQKIYPDAVLRKADAQFMVKDYSNAIKNYDEIIDNNAPNTDYAIYQKGMLYGLTSQPTEKINSMQNLISRYPNSLYYDDALFQLANTYFLNRQLQQATATFDRLLKERPNSRYQVQALLKLALINYNNNNDDQAIAYYRQVAQNYPNTPEAREALAQIKEISIKAGKPELYFETSGASLSEQDTVLFRTAENYYYEGNCEKAITELSKYLARFNDGYFATSARFYRADCYFNKKEYEQAMQDYEYVIQQPGITTYAETAYSRAARISHLVNNNYEKAFDYYLKLLEYASSKNNTIDALKGLMITSFRTKKYDATEKYARQLLTMDQISDETVWDVHYYLGKVAYANSNFETAMTEFTKVTEMTGNEKGVEAQYYKAEIFFKRNEFKKAEAEADDLIKNSPSFEYWVVKSLILISDIFMQRKEYAQAKATLESIVQNYKGDQTLINEAKQKLQRANQMMDQNTRIRQTNDSILIPDEPQPGN